MGAAHLTPSVHATGRPTPPPEAPAYYARGTAGWAAWWSLLHPPYTVLHLSFVVTGAALAPTLHLDRLAWTLLAFFLAMGVAAHALDELHGRPLGTRIRSRTLWTAAVLALTGAAAVGAWGARHYGLTGGLWFVAVGALLVFAYNLEWWGGRVHTDAAFALAWGAFPALTAYYAQAGRIDLVAVAGAVLATAMAATQRALSTPARTLRRRTHHVEGHMVDAGGARRPITRETLLAAPEAGLRALVRSGVALALVLVVRHVL